MRKERFSAHRRSKLYPRGDGPFQVLERINNNAYKLHLRGEYNVSASFNVSDLSPFDAGNDLRSNPFEKRGDDVSFGPASNDSLHILVGPITRSRAKKIKVAIQDFVQTMRAETETRSTTSKTPIFKMSMNKEEPTLVHLIQTKDHIKCILEPIRRLEGQNEHNLKFGDQMTNG
ncbi:RNA-directed DNA polymerase [Abeliophyllum distichum]|uniref:RNA-directed DNA polymerase n=1 Tax=Abeliophyllum distichum TaxID=126358 RepID=A0ABD1P294_9LAMI